MIDASELGNHLKSRGFDFYSGVPCSFLKYLINYAASECDYVMATNEGDAVATCAGAIMGGRKAVFLCQNSGLTNASSPLSSLTYTYRIPLLGFVSLRGEPHLADAPQHALMGTITTTMLDSLEIAWEFLTHNPSELQTQVDRANAVIATGRSFFFVVRKGTLAPFQLAPKKQAAAPKQTSIGASTTPELPTRRQALEILRAGVDDKTALLATTGYTGRELYQVEDAASHFYMMGSMGCIGSLGLGLALTTPTSRFVAVDGDGALMMRLGSLPTNGFYHPPNLFHLLLDNGAYESTGGQLTISPRVDFIAMAKAAGYPRAVYAHGLKELGELLVNWTRSPALTFVHLHIRSGTSEKLGRPKRSPTEIKERLMSFLSEGLPAGDERC
jgi:phosphonopyruvate decarboxylase